MTTEAVIYGIANYINVNEPTPVKPGAEPNYRMRLYIDTNQTDMNAVQAAVNLATQEQFGANPPANLAMPFHPSDEDGLPGWWHINTKSSSKVPPALFNQARVKVAALPPNEMPAGCRVAAVVKFKGYRNGTNVGVGTYLQAVQLIDASNPVHLLTGRDYSDCFHAVPGAPQELAPTMVSQPQQQQPMQQPQQPGGYYPQQPQPNPMQVPQAAQMGNGVMPGAPAMSAPGQVPTTAPQPAPTGVPGMNPPAGYAPSQDALAQIPAAPPGPGAPAQPAAGYPSNGGGQWPYQQ